MHTRVTAFSLLCLLASSFAVAQRTGYIANNYTNPHVASGGSYAWPANFSVSIAFNAQESGRPRDLAANMGLNQIPYSVRISIQASGESIFDGTVDGVIQRFSDQASIIGPLNGVRRDIRAGEPVLLTITPLREISMAPSAHPGFPAVKIGTYPETGLSFYLKSAPLTDVSIKLGRNDRMDRRQKLCPPWCAMSAVSVGSRVHLRAQGQEDRIIITWGGICAGTTGQVCSFTVSENASPVTVDFARGYALTITPDTYGAIRAASFECPQVCEQKVPAGTAMTLTGAPVGNRHFGYWTGACAGQGNPCSLTMNEAANVGVHFALRYEDPRVNESCWDRKVLDSKCCNYGWNFKNSCGGVFLPGCCNPKPGGS